MLEGREITNTQVDEMKELMIEASADTLAQEFHQLALNNLDKVVERNGEFVKDDYIKYYWDFLYEIQVVEMLKITLGLDIWGLEFIKDAELKGETYTADIARHHLEKIKALYTMFKFSKDVDYSKKLIPFKDFVIALAPLMQKYHNQLDTLKDFGYNTQLAMHRLMHLYELIQIPFVKDFDYQSAFLKEFQSREVRIEGKEVKIWDKFDAKLISQWIDRWIFVKTKGYEAFLLDTKKGYPNFYKFRYLPIENDFRLFLNGKKPMNNKLFFNERMRNKFWSWFLSDYLRNNKYPII
ncbi:MAG: hypothetical protein ACFFC3_03065 [Candidatus Odinarchaeota archaeon]